jgi:hypothetical protein
MLSGERVPLPAERVGRIRDARGELTSNQARHRTTHDVLGATLITGECGVALRQPAAACRAREKLKKLGTDWLRSKEHHLTPCYVNVRLSRQAMTADAAPSVWRAWRNPLADRTADLSSTMREQLQDDECNS